MTRPDRKHCRQCGQELNARGLGDRCPQCLLQLALTPPPEDFVEDATAPPPASPPTERRFFAGYELLEEISQGGMGVVYRARQLDPDREVALKMIHPANRTTPAARLRFQVEVAAVSRLNHPRIVALYESGECDGVCFFSMSLIRGPSLDRRLASEDWTREPRRGVELLRKAALAVHYAHERGILHRDLKPSNILIDSAGEPCIADFGLAKIQEMDAGLTRDHSVLGSPSYMAPEQARGNGAEATTVVDVYSLGAILYELLTGVPPFRGATPLETLRRVIDEAPPPPRQRIPSLDRDLESICLKALEKNPARRYSSALALADDLGCWMDGRAVEARPVSSFELAWRWTRRRPALAGLCAVTLLSMLAFGIGSTLVARRLKVASDETHQLIRRLQHEKAETLLGTEETSKGLALLARLTRQRPEDDVAGLRLASVLSQRPLAVPIVTPWVSGAEVLAVGFTPDNQHSIAIARNGRVQRVNLATGEAFDAILAPRGDQLVLAIVHSRAGLAIVVHADGWVRLWRLTALEAPLTEFKHPSPVTQVRYHPVDDSLALVDGQGRLTLWRSPNAPVDGWRWGMSRVPIPAGERVSSLDFEPAGSRLAVGLESGSIEVFGLPSLARVDHNSLRGKVAVVEFSADGQRLAAATTEGALAVWTLDQEDGTLDRGVFEGAPTDLEFSPDGRSLAVAGWSRHHEVCVWDLNVGMRLRKRLQHRNQATALRFSPDGLQLITLGHDDSARCWDTRSWLPSREALWHASAPLQAAFSADSRKVLTGSYSGSICWDAASPPGKPEPLDHDSDLTSAAFSPVGKGLATGTLSGLLTIWDAAGQRGFTVHAHREPVYFLGFSRAGDWVATGDGKGEVRVWSAGTGDATSPSLVHPAPIRSMAFSPSEEKLLTAGMDGMARVWRVPGNTLAYPPLAHSSVLLGARFSPKGDRIATYGEGRDVKVWDAGTGLLASHPLPHEDWVGSVEFGPDGRLLITSGRKGQVIRWDTSTGRRIGKPIVHSSAVGQIVVSPDGEWLAMASSDGLVRVVAVGSDTAEPISISHAAALTFIEFTPDSRWLLSVTRGGGARLWDPRTGLPVSEPMRMDPPCSLASIRPDGEALLTYGDSRRAGLWPLPRYAASRAGSLVQAAEVVGRMKMLSHSHFMLTPAADRAGLPSPLDLRSIVFPDSPDAGSTPASHERNARATRAE